ncbi:hypothetical protein DPMN_041601 [Dreissena polymorpha]|uniref:Uncharacterized protein n=1 Tax=Dreissena polymorpha TaxID=45954 RepID=A0A9D4CZC7_DREPO|nr:hypothetical protein DPMN_041601 [Dreissena polymorpha]
MMLVLVFICLTICQVARGNGVSALAYSSLMVDKMTRMENKLADLENNLKETRVKMETMVQNVNGILDRRTGELDLIKGTYSFFLLYALIK